MTDDDHEEPPPPRRDFLGVAITSTAAALGVMAGYPVARFLRPNDDAGPRRVVVGDVEKFPRGSSRTVLLGERPALVVRLEDGSFRAFVALCSHLGCVVGYSQKNKRIECGCHGGVYSLEGQNVSGPPPRPLRPLAVEVSGGVLTLSEV